jgi:hypothetical protein
MVSFNPARNRDGLQTLTTMSKARTIEQRLFPPWEVLELEGGYAVEDAAGRRLGTFFYGRPDAAATARRDDSLTMEEARQTAFDFAKLGERLGRLC